MSKKKIIIDGVDVSGCKNLMQGIVPFGCMEDRKTCSCMNNPNCLYKQFKRKEQEYEELRQYHNKCCEENAKKLEEWLEKYNQISRDFYNGDYCNTEHCSLLKAKEQECEELKKECEIWKNQVLTIDDETITVQITHQQFKDYNQLKTENYLYKNAHKTEQDRRRSYENALTEIKEIASKTLWTYSNLDDVTKYNMFDKILQIINEVEDDRCRSN